MLRDADAIDPLGARLPTAPDSADGLVSRSTTVLPGQQSARNGSGRSVHQQYRRCAVLRNSAGSSPRCRPPIVGIPHVLAHIGHKDAISRVADASTSTGTRL